MMSKSFEIPCFTLSCTISDLIKNSENVSQTQKYAVAVYVAVHAGLAKSHLTVYQTKKQKFTLR